MKLIDFIKKDHERAEGLIKSGAVFVNGKKIESPSFQINETDNIEIRKKKEWVSRGAYKLLSAIEKFNMDLKDKVVLDIGSSTGGFTEVALSKGASKVYSLDVGTNQLDYKLRVNENVEVLEKTNLKTITESMFDNKIDIVVTDVSFISLKRVFDVLSKFTYSLSLMALIKPQFEANKNQIENGGFVREELHDEIIYNIKEYATSLGFEFVSLNESPILGSKSKNKEYISLFKWGVDEL